MPRVTPHEANVKPILAERRADVRGRGACAGACWTGGPWRADGTGHGENSFVRVVNLAASPGRAACWEPTGMLPHLATRMSPAPRSVTSLLATRMSPAPRSATSVLGTLLAYSVTL